MRDAGSARRPARHDVERGTARCPLTMSPNSPGARSRPAGSSLPLIEEARNREVHRRADVHEFDPPLWGSGPWGWPPPRSRPPWGGPPGRFRRPRRRDGAPPAGVLSRTAQGPEVTTPGEQVPRLSGPLARGPRLTEPAGRRPRAPDRAATRGELALLTNSSLCSRPVLADALCPHRVTASVSTSRPVLSSRRALRRRSFSSSSSKASARRANAHRRRIERGLPARLSERASPEGARSPRVLSIRPLGAPQGGTSVSLKAPRLAGGRGAGWFRRRARRWLDRRLRR